MYAAHFGFNALPFENAPDPSFFFNQGQYNEVLVLLMDSVNAGRGLMVLAGPIGSGKTTLSQKLVSNLSKKIKLIWLAEPPTSFDDLVLFIAQEIGLDTSGKSRLFLLRDTHAKLLALRAEGLRCLLIIDECHRMTGEVLEGIRILTNLEQGPYKLLQILLLGQEELVDKLNHVDRKALKQRISSFKILGQLDANKTRRYILHRLDIAGGSATVFSDHALNMLCLFSGGIPRVINSFCHHSLLVAYGLGGKAVSPDHVHKAAEELDLSQETFHYLLKLRQEKQGSVSASQPPHNEGPNRRKSGNQDSSPQESSKSPENADIALRPRPESKPWKRGAQSVWAAYFLPLLVLFLSILSLVASLWYYTNKAGF